MNDPSNTNTSMTLPPHLDRSGVTDAVRAQLLATEHWSLLATRSMTWNEVFSRASMFITMLSAAVVALALVAQATAFGQAFRLFALLVLPIVLLVGIGTILRLGHANTDDVGLLLGMNRLRHAYLELAPELEPYFVTGSHDDAAGLAQSYSLGIRSGPNSFLSGTPNLVAAITCMVTGVLAALIAQTLGAPDGVSVVIGVIAALAAAVVFVAWGFRTIARARRTYRPRFPS